MWNLGDNVLLGLDLGGDASLRVLAVRHYAIPETIHAAAGIGPAA
jgi:hypothetical protein